MSIFGHRANITLLGSQIMLESTLGVGSTFVVTLPACMADPLAATTAQLLLEAQEVGLLNRTAGYNTSATML